MVAKHQPPESATIPHCRRNTQRRRLSLATIRMGMRYGNRRHGRRAIDQFGHYVDRYEPQLLYAAFGILLLSGIDTVLTLNLLSMGAREINPFMALLMKIDIGLFTMVKIGVTSIGLVFLVIHMKFRLFRMVQTSSILYGILPIYVCLVVYELALLAGYN